MGRSECQKRGVIVLLSPGRIGYILMLSFGLSVLTFVTPR
jgi:hypothetical protein